MSTVRGAANSVGDGTAGSSQGRDESPARSSRGATIGEGKDATGGSRGGAESKDESAAGDSRGAIASEGSDKGITRGSNGADGHPPTNATLNILRLNFAALGLKPWTLKGFE